MSDDNTQDPKQSDVTPANTDATDAPLDAEVVEAAAPESVDPLAAAQADAARFRDQALRALADLDNVRKRGRREVEDAKRQAREEFLRELLPVFDNVERALQSAERATEVKSVVEGLGMVLRQFESVLGKQTIVRVPTVGSPFDPQVHEAIQQVETDEHAPGTVMAEVQGGWLQGDRLVRAALVVVAKAKSGSDGAAS